MKIHFPLLFKCLYVWCRSAASRVLCAMLHNMLCCCCLLRLTTLPVSILIKNVLSFVKQQNEKQKKTFFFILQTHVQNARITCIIIFFFPQFGAFFCRYDEILIEKCLFLSIYLQPCVIHEKFHQMLEFSLVSCVCVCLFFFGQKCVKK